MPRYVVERDFGPDLRLPLDDAGARACSAIVERNRLDNVTWLHSYLSPGSSKSFCIYEAPSPESLRRAANRNGLQIRQITEVQLLDPYFYRPL